MGVLALVFWAHLGAPVISVSSLTCHKLVTYLITYEGWNVFCLTLGVIVINYGIYLVLTGQLQSPPQQYIVPAMWILCIVLVIFRGLKSPVHIPKLFT